MNVVQDSDVSEVNERLAKVYEEQGPRLWRSLVGYTGDPEIASEAVAEVFAQALARGDAIEKAEAWIWRSGFRIAAGELKARSRERSSELEGSYDFPEPLDDVIAALLTISPNQRLAVVMHDYADRPTDEVAKVMGTTRATVYLHLSEGRRRLRRVLEDRDE
jgi:RNA polymerase sigma-70 factor (ECF subfamily)